MPQHVCGQCQQQFTSEEDYLNHTCPSTGFNPTDPNHLGEEFKEIQKAALARGQARKPEILPTPKTIYEEQIISAVKAARKNKNKN